MSYTAYIVRIKNIQKHSNADRLNVGTCLGSQVIIGLDIHENDLGIYFPVDGQLSTEYCIANNLLRIKDATGKQVGGYLEPDKRNIRALKLRGEISDGLFITIKSLETFGDISKLKEGDRLTAFNGHELCTKYIPKSAKQDCTPSCTKNKAIKHSYPFFQEHVDTEQLMPNLTMFNPGDIITITLKMHGTSGRTAKTVCVNKKWNWFRNTFHIGPKVTESIEVVTGTRRCILTDSYEGAGGGLDERKAYHEYLSSRLHEGEEIYYEIVGWFGDKSIMNVVDNRKINDKEFIKKYGDTTTFSYGCEEGTNAMYVYRMTLTDKEGNVVEYPSWTVKQRCEEMGIKTVPMMDQFIYTTEQDLLERVERYVGDVDPIGLTHIREGVVVRIENKKSFTAYKHKNFEFKCLEGIVKDSATAPDIEEAEELAKGKET